jgi:hypothetical protein
VKQWNAERDAALDAARKAAGQKVSQAKAELEAEAAQAGRPFRPPPEIWPAGGARRAARGRRGFPLRDFMPQCAFFHRIFVFSGFAGGAGRRPRWRRPFRASRPRNHASAAKSGRASGRREAAKPEAAKSEEEEQNNVSGWKARW